MNKSIAVNEKNGKKGMQINGDNGLDDDDSFDQSDDEDMDEQYDWMNNPFTIIDENANLEEVLAAKTIGEAMQILCPHIPGLPTKSRGKYKKRKLLTNEEKSEVLRATNRENARLTRKRKKIYHDVISSLLIKLHQDLGNDAVKKYVNIVNEGKSRSFLEAYNQSSGASVTSTSTTGNDSLETSTKLSKIPNSTSKKKSFFSPSSVDFLPSEGISSISPSETITGLPTSIITELDSAEACRQARLAVTRRYLDYKVSSCNSAFCYSSELWHQNINVHGWSDAIPCNDDWYNVCVPEIVHIMPLPVFRDMSAQSKILPSGYECHGISSIIDDITPLRAFCHWVVSQRYMEKDQVLWNAVIEIAMDSVLVNSYGNQICLDYNMALYVMPLNSQTPTLTSQSSSSSSYNLNNCQPISPNSPTKQRKQQGESSRSNSNISPSQPQIIKIMDIPVVLTADFSTDGRLRLVTEHYDVMQILFEKEQLKHLKLMENSKKKM